MHIAEKFDIHKANILSYSHIDQKMVHGLTVSPSSPVSELDTTNGEVGMLGDKHLIGGSMGRFGEDDREVVGEDDCDVVVLAHNFPTCMPL